MKTADEMIKINAELQEQLNSKNKQYYEDLLIYMRTENIFRDDQVLENVLLNVWVDILTAQQNGEDAVEYFGNHPKEHADELLKEIQLIPFWKRILYGGLLWVFILCILVLTSSQELNVISLFMGL